ncbi:O-antigen polymerase [Shewanella sp. HL-SH4]|uniref:O-antigen polymerase n=1 Tax=Shewanella sp. HL-SH4 TaxID=3436240 RepID=UPI003EBD4248
MYEFKFLIITIFFFSILFFYMKIKKKETNTYNIEVILSLVIFIYALPVAIANLFGLDNFQLGDDRIINIYFGYILCALLILVGFYVSSISFSSLNNNEISDKVIIDKQRLVMFFVLFAGILLYSIYILTSYDNLAQMIQDTSREERFANAKGKGIFTSGIYLINFAWLFLFYSDLRSKNSKILKIHIILLLLYILFFSASGDRRVWVSLVIGMVFMWSTINKLPIIKMIIFGVISLVFLQVFSKIRGYSHSIDEMFNFFILNFTYEWFDFSSGEFGWHYLIVSDVIDFVKVYGMEFGKTYMLAPLVSIPSFIYENKPTGLSPWYASIYFPDYFSSGGTLAFSFLAESYLNFSLAGPILIPFIFGYFIAVFLRFLKSKFKMEFFITICASLLSTVLIFARSDFSAVINQIVISIFLPISIYFFCTFVIRLGTIKIRF